MGKIYVFKKKYLALSIFLCFFLINIRSQITLTYTYTGAVQYFTVPICVTTVSADVRGAQGGDGASDIRLNGTALSNFVIVAGSGSRISACGRDAGGGSGGAYHGGGGGGAGFSIGANRGGKNHT